MRLTLAEPKLLKESISIISDLVTETKFRVGKDFVEIIAMDPANVAMVIFRMPSNSFAEYVVSEETVLAMNLASFKQVLRRAKPNDVLTLEKTDNKLKVILKEKNTRTFYLPLIDLEDKPQKVPQLNAKAVVSLPSSVLSEAIEDVDIVSESVTFIAEKNSLTVSATGDLKNADVVIGRDDTVSITSEDVEKSKYSIEYLKKMIQGGKLVSTVVLKFSNDYPLTLEFAEKDKLSLSFILAPRVDND
ncbi:proliferating cell nuclear antigen (pcna) [Candidatus Woesearchaeota archaeon]|nr:proliferating cell nuclear antigen (pcna) [Candidatus Woesearchaeota archaeon]